MMTLAKAMTCGFPDALGKPDVSQQAALFHWPLADDVDIYL